MIERHYLLVVSPGPAMMILRVPWPMPRWPDILRATGAVLRSHALRQKDLYRLDGLVGIPSRRTDEDRVLVDRVEEGYAGALDRVPRFWLYDWSRGGFKLARAAMEEGAS